VSTTISEVNQGNSFSAIGSDSKKNCQGKSLGSAGTRKSQGISPAVFGVLLVVGIGFAALYCRHLSSKPIVNNAQKEKGGEFEVSTADAETGGWKTEVFNRKNERSGTIVKLPEAQIIDACVDGIPLPTAPTAPPI